MATKCSWYRACASAAGGNAARSLFSPGQPGKDWPGPTRATDTVSGKDKPGKDLTGPLSAAGPTPRDPLYPLTATDDSDPSAGPGCPQAGPGD